jgi:RepB DNA-primase from phage plasmid/CHC2 zinc finger
VTTATVSSASAAASNLDSYLRALAGPKPGARLLEIRFALRHRDMGRVFFAAHSAGGAARFIRRLAVRTDVYLGVALRDRRSGGRDAIDRSHLLFIEIDSPDGERGLENFAHPPTMLIASGTPGHVHAYWTLRPPVGVHQLERANRRLAYHLGGDLASVDGARILRPPSSWNHKHTPPAPVRLLDLDPARRYEPSELVDGLPDPPHKPGRGQDQGQRRVRHPLDRALLAIPAEQYVQALTGIRPNRARKIPCPFHDDRDPSLQLYGDASWYCFGCRRGGTIYDFAALLWGAGTKDHAFLKLRSRLAQVLGVQ